MGLIAYNFNLNSNTHFFQKDNLLSLIENHTKLNLQKLITNKDKHSIIYYEHLTNDAFYLDVDNHDNMYLYRSDPYRGYLWYASIYVIAKFVLNSGGGKVVFQDQYSYSLNNETELLDFLHDFDIPLYCRYSYRVAKKNMFFKAGNVKDSFPDDWLKQIQKLNYKKVERI